MRVAVTGASGFIGKNLVTRLGELKTLKVTALPRSTDSSEWKSELLRADAVVHLAGVNRPQDPGEFISGNCGTTQALVDALAGAARRTPVVYASSTRAAEDSPYGRSKKAAEDILFAYAHETGANVSIFRLPNVFGKWSRPNYNSAVATFCHNVARNLPIQVHDPAAPITLAYIDDVIAAFIAALESQPSSEYRSVAPTYESTVGAVSEQIQRFHSNRNAHLVDAVGCGLTRALYATYISFLDLGSFSHPLTVHADQRGVFSEILKTRDSGQFSFFTALPGVTRGGHYHHTKTEKFLVVQGEALFRFRNIVTGQTHEIVTRAESPSVVETVPGWAHDIKNIGSGVLISLLWANEIFDPTHPDTIAAKV